VANTAGIATSETAELDVATVVYVKKDADAGYDGTSWDKAYNSLDDALTKGSLSGRSRRASGSHGDDTPQ